MKFRLIELFVVASTLSACAESVIPKGIPVLGELGEIAVLAGDTQALFEPLKMAKFCDTRSNYLDTSIRRYANKSYVFTGKIRKISKNDNDNFSTVNISENINDEVWAKVYNLSSQKEGDFASIQGRISPANFKKENLTKCRILLDEGKFVQTKK